MNYLILAVSIATFGFIAWFAASKSLLLPVRFQIMYDANPPYVFRIYSRRIIGFIIYGIIPLIVILCTGWLKHASFKDLNLHFHWNIEVAKWLLFSIPLLILIHAFTTKSNASLEQFPEVRVRFWRPHILVKSALFWVLYLIASEFLYRGLLFQSLLLCVEDITAIIICTGIYAMSHYFKRNRVSLFSIFYGALACYIVLKTGSLLPVIIIQVVNALAIEWFSLYYHPEMYVTKT